MNVIELERLLDFGKVYDGIHTILITHRESIQPKSPEQTALSILRLVMNSEIVDECYREQWRIVDTQKEKP